MSSSIDRLAKDLYAIIDKKQSKKPTDYESTAVVSRIENQTMWVRFPGNDFDTPVSNTVEAALGDTVKVRVANGRATATGNITTPATDDTEALNASNKADDALVQANRAKQAADTADAEAQRAIEKATIAEEKATEAAASAKAAAISAENAETSAEAAATSAQNAESSASSAASSASSASTSAQNAETSATQALTDAGIARTSAEQAEGYAEDAQASADSAIVYANSAFSQLSFVEDIVGVLDLIKNHSSYTQTQDESVIPNKWYFRQAGTSYEVVTNPESVWFYFKTEDTEIVEGKNYYTRSDSEPYVYTLVTDPVVADIGNYYERTNSPSANGFYELSAIDETITNYVSSQLTVTDKGLWLQQSGNTNQTKVLLSATDGVVLYGGQGQIVGKYGESTQIGNADGYYVAIGNVLSLVANPTGNPSTSGYYEMTEVQNPQGNPKEEGWYEEINTGVYRLSSDLVVSSRYYEASESTDTSIVSGKSYYAVQPRLSFMNVNNEVAYMTNDELYITRTVVVDRMALGLQIQDGGIGQWAWQVHDNKSGKNNLRLKWIG